MNKFPISSDVISLRTVFENQKNYVIPAYQRPYEWNEGNLESFLQSIFDGFTNHKQVFFGTMQVAQNLLDDECLDIVDGQQRITTFLLFLNILCNGAPNTIYLEKIKENPINPVFGIDIDSKYLKNYNIEKYRENTDILRKKLDVYINKENKTIDPQDLIRFVLDNVYIVFLETAKEMPLSDVVAVFNTINTTGLDLNAADVFKFRYYDFLNVVYKNEKEDWMEKINECYVLVEQSNSEDNVGRIEMSWILDVYKHAICAKLGLKYSELSKSNMKFFEDLFDKVEQDKTDPILKYDSFRRLVEGFVDYYRWIEKHCNSDSCTYPSDPIELFSYHMLEKTRYSRYWTIPFVSAFFVFYRNPSADREKAYVNGLRINLSFFKYFLIYSVLYAKVINDVQNRVCRLLKLFVSEEYTAICSKVEDLMWLQWTEKEDVPEERAEKDKWEERGFWKNIKINLYDNGSRAHLICTLCALIEEIDSKVPLDEINQKLFHWDSHPYDIEHIWAREQYDNDKRLDDAAREELNGIGNLTVLNRSINRKIKDNPTEKKAKQYSLKPKEKYGYKVIERLCNDYDLDSWQNPNMEQVRKRQQNELNKILTFMNNRTYLENK